MPYLPGARSSFNGGEGVDKTAKASAFRPTITKKSTNHLWYLKWLDLDLLSDVHASGGIWRSYLILQAYCCYLYNSKTVHPQHCSNIMQSVPIFKCATEIFFYTSDFVLNLFLVYQSFHFHLLSDLFCSDQAFQSLWQQTIFYNFRHGITLWVYTLSSTFSQKYATLTLNNKHIPRNEDNWLVLRLFKCNREKLSKLILYITCDC
jgi:hypothetical protein